MAKATLLNQSRQRRQRIQKDIAVCNGGKPALNFINTLKNRGGEMPSDSLTNYEDFIYWGQGAGIIDYDYYHTLSLEAYCYAEEAKSVFEEVVKARFVLYELFLSVIKKETADEIVINHFNTLIDTSSKYLRYESTPLGLRQVWLNINEEIAGPLWIIVHAAAGLLLKGNPEKIKQCRTCGTIFFDSTKNGARRWCSPLACGRALKAKRYYHTKKKVRVREKNNQILIG